MSFQLPDLNYGFDALEPHIDTKTMQIHHGKHHAGYTSKLNTAIEGTDLEGKNIESILSEMDMNNSAVRNNGGGYYNHCLLENSESKRWWKSLRKNSRGYFKFFESFEDFNQILLLLQVKDSALMGLALCE